MKLTVTLLLTALLLAGCGKPHIPPAKDPMGDLPTFWASFRASVRSGDAAGLQRVVRVPFETHGARRDDPVITYTEPALPAIIAVVMEQQIGSNLEWETMAQYMERQVAVPEAIVGDQRSRPIAADATRFSAGRFNFKKIDGRWWAVSAYLE